MSVLPPLLGGRRRGLIVRLVTNGLAQTATSVLFVLGLHSVVESATSQSATAPTLLMATALAALVLTLGWLRVLAQRHAEELGQDYVHQVRLRLFRHLCTLSYRTQQKRSQGATLLRFIGDLSALRQWISLGLARLCVAAITALGTLLALVWVSPTLALAVAIVLIVGAISTILLGKPLHKSVLESRRQRARLANQVSEKTGNIEVIQAHGQEKRERLVINRYSKRLKTAMISRAVSMGHLRAATQVTAMLSIACAVVLGSYGVAAGMMRASEIVAAMAVVGMLIPPIRDLGRVYEYWRRASVSIDKLENFLSTRREVIDAKGAKPLRIESGGIELHNLSIEGVLDKVSTGIPGGSVVALLGANGSGKSTLLGLLGRQINAEAGSILIDGQDIRGVTLRSLHECVSILGPDLPLMRGSFRRNLCYRDPNASEETQWVALRMSGAAALVNALPGGLDTRLSSRGTNLSVGQRQRIALARAVLGQPPILLLDEVDANLDEEAKELFYSMIQNYPGTVVMATHDAHLASLADITWMLVDRQLHSLPKNPSEEARTTGAVVGL
ncbi:MAG: ABC transporter ATP-binding protein/permease [Gammaproteobacteria bacterium]|nr:ABC transporter ATP-binding protein/permease [Gammaproteobacteria bacterium]